MIRLRIGREVKLSELTAGLVVTTALLGVSGCAAPMGQNQDLNRCCRVYYVDGAGGSSVLTNWGVGVRDGLELAGFQGGFESFVWQTGLGVAADQATSVEYKREKGTELAAEMRTYMRSHPSAPIGLIGLSAGTAIATFALESLPDDLEVENVVFLGSSLSAHYDLSGALRHVRNRMYVYTSPKDAVLATLVPLAGTAERDYCGACAAGLHGFHMCPKQRDPVTCHLYAKLENIEWQPAFAKDGNYGGHTDAVNPRFVCDYVAPVLMERGPRYTRVAEPPVTAKR